MAASNCPFPALRIALLTCMLALCGFGSARPLAAEELCETRADDLVTLALHRLGTPYRFGGESWRGIDCAAFVRSIFRSIGVALPRTAAAQFKIGRNLLRDELSKGDLVFFRNTYRRGISHVGICIGDGRFIHAAGRKRGVVIVSMDCPYFARRFAGARRVVETSEPLALLAGEVCPIAVSE